MINLNKHLIISGQVQGVGFRYSAMQKAMEFQLTGWVRNKSNGTVELEVEGEEKQINSYIDELKNGFNRFIQVDHMEITSQQEKGYDKFTIK
ncbi:acylphosphatase [Virgibacillus saliphilus]|uniref:acylphosphatase n=1 Tax=Virgibacillus saliphilus TaxID=2831674 RepID=UPI00281579BA|nr:acylphosphatase [Virgibacillus sp. NKC19-3]